MVMAFHICLLPLHLTITEQGVDLGQRQRAGPQQGAERHGRRVLQLSHVWPRLEGVLAQPLHRAAQPLLQMQARDGGGEQAATRKAQVDLRSGQERRGGRLLGIHRQLDFEIDVRYEKFVIMDCVSRRRCNDYGLFDTGFISLNNSLLWPQNATYTVYFWLNFVQINIYMKVVSNTLNTNDTHWHWADNRNCPIIVVLCKIKNKLNSVQHLSNSHEYHHRWYPLLNQLNIDFSYKSRFYNTIQVHHRC